jgi:muramoyltetrapeptide carboxypeptidase LdcA involved in peptidoglycan recycling
VHQSSNISLTKKENTMITKLKQGDKVAIVSLSSGVLGEKFVAHELKLGEKRLKEMGLVPVFMPNSLKGLDYLSNHPEARAEDLKTAFKDNEIKMVLSAIGGNDSYKTLPYLLSDKTFISNVKKNPKIFMGFSDTTTSHIMFHKLGLNTFYGPAFLTDFAEFESEMLSYTKNAINFLFEPTKNYKIKSSDVWFLDRTDFSPAAVGTLRVKNQETKGYEVLQGSKKVTGELLGGCIDVLGYLLVDGNTDYRMDAEKFDILNKFNIFPTLDDWKDKILFIETSEEKTSPETFKNILLRFKKYGIFDKISGVIVGKPIDEVFYEDYKNILKETFAPYDFPVMINLNFGHSTPRTIIPYGATAELDPTQKTLTILKPTIS